MKCYMSIYGLKPAKLKRYSVVNDNVKVNFP